MRKPTHPPYTLLTRASNARLRHSIPGQTAVLVGRDGAAHPWASHWGVLRTAPEAFARFMAPLKAPPGLGSPAAPIFFHPAGDERKLFALTVSRAFDARHPLRVFVDCYGDATWNDGAVFADWLVDEVGGDAELEPTPPPHGHARGRTAKRTKLAEAEARVAKQWQGLSKGRPLSSFPKRALERGAAVEQEHVGGHKPLARRIAADHLVEDPKYYEKLARIERKAGRSGGAFDGFDLFDDVLDSKPGVPSPKHVLEQQLGELGAMASASEALHPAGQALLAEPMITSFRKARAWAVTPRAGEVRPKDTRDATYFGERLFKQLVSRRSLPAHVTDFSDKTLYVLLPEGPYAVSPPVKVSTKKAAGDNLSLERQRLVDKARAVLGSTGATLTGSADKGYTLALKASAAMRKKGVPSGTLTAPTLDLLEVRLDQTLARIAAHLGA